MLSDISKITGSFNINSHFSYRYLTATAWQINEIERDKKKLSEFLAGKLYDVGR